jgi:hypothetical protein
MNEPITINFSPTVLDGSITLAKLSESLQQTIQESGGGSSSQIFIQNTEPEYVADSFWYKYDTQQLYQAGEGWTLIPFVKQSDFDDLSNTLQTNLNNLDNRVDTLESATGSTVNVVTSVNGGLGYSSGKYSAIDGRSFFTGFGAGYPTLKVLIVRNNILLSSADAYASQDVDGNIYIYLQPSQPDFANEFIEVHFFWVNVSYETQDITTGGSGGGGGGNVNWTIGDGSTGTHNENDMLIYTGTTPTGLFIFRNGDYQQMIPPAKIDADAVHWNVDDAVDREGLTTLSLTFLDNLANVDAEHYYLDVYRDGLYIFGGSYGYSIDSDGWMQFSFATPTQAGEKYIFKLVRVEGVSGASIVGLTEDQARNITKDYLLNWTFQSTYYSRIKIDSGLISASEITFSNIQIFADADYVFTRQIEVFKNGQPLIDGSDYSISSVDNVANIVSIYCFDNEFTTPPALNDIYTMKVTIFGID